MISHEATAGLSVPRMEKRTKEEENDRPKALFPRCNKEVKDESVLAPKVIRFTLPLMVNQIGAERNIGERNDDTGHGRGNRL